jgi:hypothetical protein
MRSDKMSSGMTGSSSVGLPSISSFSKICASLPPVLEPREQALDLLFEPVVV